MKATEIRKMPYWSIDDCDQLAMMVAQLQTWREACTAITSQYDNAITGSTTYQRGADSRNAEVERLKAELITDRDNARQVNDDLRREITALHREYQGQIQILGENLKLAEGMASYEVAAAKERECEAMRKQVTALHDATIILRNGMGGHNHWDETMRHGEGCVICQQQQAARRQATALIESVSLNTEAAAGGEKTK